MADATLAEAEQWMREDRDDHGRDCDFEALILAEYDRRDADRTTLARACDEYRAEGERLRARVAELEAIERRGDEASTWCGDSFMHRAVRYIRTGSTGDPWEVKS